MQNDINRKKVLITGGAGFIGSHLADALIGLNRKVVIIDDLSAGDIGNINPGAAFYKVNTADNDKVKEIFLKEKPDLVYHLAANTNVPLSVADPVHDFRQSLAGAVNVIDACKNAKVEKIIYLSSGFIYGNTKNRPTQETESPTAISPYAITKTTVENYLSFYKKTYGLPFVVLRPATVYGPRQRGGAMSDYIHKLSKGEQAVLYGDGSKTRDYLYISDAVSALLKLSDLPADFEDPVFNIGTAKETSLKDLYCKIAGFMGKKAEPVFMPERPGELLFYSLNSDKLRKAINWMPQYDIDNGLIETLKFRRLI